MDLFECSSLVYRGDKMTEEEIQLYLPGLLLAELFDSEFMYLDKDLNSDERQSIRDYIDKLYLYGKQHGLNTFELQYQVQKQIGYIVLNPEEPFGGLKL